jgi:hypothetical protein
VKDAARIEIQCADTHLDACLAETMLIQKHRPRWNIVGAYSFLYPLIGIRSVNGNIEFCMTTDPDAVLGECPAFSFTVLFRSRRITGDAFFALMRLLKFVGTSIPRVTVSASPGTVTSSASEDCQQSGRTCGWRFYKGESASVTGRARPSSL